MFVLQLFIRTPISEGHTGFFPCIGYFRKFHQSMGGGFIERLQSQSQFLQWMDWYPPLLILSVFPACTEVLCFMILLPVACPEM